MFRFRCSGRSHLPLRCLTKCCPHQLLAFLSSFVIPSSCSSVLACICRNNSVKRSAMLSALLAMAMWTPMFSVYLARFWRCVVGVERHFVNFMERWGFYMQRCKGGTRCSVQVFICMVQEWCSCAQICLLPFPFMCDVCFYFLELKLPVCLWFFLGTCCS